MCNTQLFHNKTRSFPSCPKAPPESKRPQSGASGHIALHLSRMADRLPGACLLSPASQRMQPHIHRRPSSVTGQLHWLVSCSSTYPSTGKHCDSLRWVRSPAGVSFLHELVYYERRGEEMETRRAQCANPRRQMQNCFFERHWVTNSFLGREGTALRFVIPDIGTTVLCS